MAEAPAAFRDLDPEEAGQLMVAGKVRLLDVRTVEEYRDGGHLPGSILLPVDRIASAPGVLEREGPPLLVYCEHGIRSQMAAAFLTRAGYREVLNLRRGLAASAALPKGGTIYISVADRDKADVVPSHR